MSDLIAKEKEVKLSRLKHNLLEDELKLLKKLEEVKRIEDEIEKLKMRIQKEENA